MTKRTKPVLTPEGALKPRRRELGGLCNGMGCSRAQRAERKVRRLEKKLKGMVPDDNMPVEELRELQYIDDYPGIRAEAKRIYEKRMKAGK